MNKKIILYLFAISTALSLQASNGYRIVTEEYPPFSYTEGNAVKGISTDIVRAILKQIGWHRTPITIIPWKKAKNFVHNDPKAIIFSMYRIPERENQYKWVGPIAKDYWNLYSLSKIENHIPEYHIYRLNDAKQYSIATQKGGAFDKLLLRNGFTHLQSTVTTEESIERLLNFQAQILAASELPLYSIMHKMKIKPSKIKCVMKVKSGDLYICFNTAAPDKVVNLFRNALKELKSDGTYDKITNSYYEKFLGE